MAVGQKDDKGDDEPFLVVRAALALLAALAFEVARLALLCLLVALDLDFETDLDLDFDLDTDTDFDFDFDLDFDSDFESDLNLDLDLDSDLAFDCDLDLDLAKLLLLLRLRLLLALLLSALLEDEYITSDLECVAFDELESLASDEDLLAALATVDVVDLLVLEVAIGWVVVTVTASLSSSAGPAIMLASMLRMISSVCTQAKSQLSRWHGECPGLSGLT